MNDYVVIRPGQGLPPGFLPPELNGRWYDRSCLPFVGAGGNEVPPHLHSAGPPAVAVPAGRFEVSKDGAVAEVYEVRV